MTYPASSLTGKRSKIAQMTAHESLTPDEDDLPSNTVDTSSVVLEGQGRRNESGDSGLDVNDADHDTLVARKRARQPGTRAVDGQRETFDDEQDADNELGADLEPERRPVSTDEWPTLDFDIPTLADPVTEPDRHEAEWRRVYKHFDPYLRYYFEDVMRYRDVDEIVAAIWRAALRKIDSLDAPANMWWWLIKIGRNYYIDERRKEARRLRRDRKGLDRITDDAPADWRDLVLDEISRETMFRDVVDRREFRKAFAMLKDDDQEFAYLLQVERRSHEELVGRFGFASEAASRQRWQWIKKKIIRALGFALGERTPTS